MANEGHKATDSFGKRNTKKNQNSDSIYKYNRSHQRSQLKIGYSVLAFVAYKDQI